MAKVLTVFIVDDDPIYCAMSRMVLQAMEIDCTIEVYNNGLDAKEAIEKIVANGDKMPDYIFLDLNMPLMDGWEFLEFFSEFDQNRSAIFIVSSTINIIEINKAKEISIVKDFISKPIVPEKLQSILDVD